MRYLLVPFGTRFDIKERAGHGKDHKACAPCDIITIVPKWHVEHSTSNPDVRFA